MREIILHPPVKKGELIYGKDGQLYHFIQLETDATGTRIRARGLGKRNSVLEEVDYFHNLSLRETEGQFRERKSDE